MVIGESKIDYDVLKSFIGRPAELVVYVESLVPKWARHVPSITYNQRFYVAIHLRAVLTIPYKQRMELVDALVDGISIHGIMSSFTPIEDIINVCNKDDLVEMLKMRLLEDA